MLNAPVAPRAARSTSSRSRGGLPIVFMFSGQGSQYFQMGRELFAGSAVFRDHLLALDELARGQLGRSVVAILYDDCRAPGEPFDELTHSHPAIFMLEVALLRTLESYGIEPDYVLGASLGEVCALVAAGVLPVEEALRLVLQQALDISALCPEGVMLAIMANTSLYAQDPVLTAHSQIAAINAPKHLVVAAERSACAKIVLHLRTQGVSHQLLPIDRAFHCSLIDGARNVTLSALRKLQRRASNGRIVISCVQGADPLHVDHLWRVAREPIGFMQTITELEAAGAHLYVDLGPSGTLATFIKYSATVRSGSRSVTLLSPFGGADARLSGLRSELSTLSHGS